MDRNCQTAASFNSFKFRSASKYQVIMLFLNSLNVQWSLVEVWTDFGQTYDNCTRITYELPATKQSLKFVLLVMFNYL